MRSETGLVLAAILGTAAPAARSGELPANTWVKLAEEPTGSRDWPAFWFDPQAKLFFLSGGLSGSLGKSNLHFDTETFDPATRKWTNAYPKGAPYKAGSGPTDAPFCTFGYADPPLKADENGVTRVRRLFGAYLCDPNMFFQHALAPEHGGLYAYLLDRTLRFDSGTHQWTDLKADRFSRARDRWLIYGSLAYDPVNREVLSVGGTSDEEGGTPGTWTYNVTSNKWTKLSTGSAEIKALHAEARALYTRTAAFINACRNRFYVTESRAEASQDLAAGANEVAAAADKLTAALGAARLAGSEANAPGIALAAMAKVAAGFRSMAGKLSGRFTGETLVEAQALQDAILVARRTLDSEPCGRAVSQMASCGASGKIVLFGGCTFDGFLADTWVYDCKTRTWEQRHPKISPAPRGGHVLAWLPKSGKVVLFGSARFTNGSYGVPYQQPAAPRDLWTYDPEANEWKLLAGESKDGPIGGVGAVSGDDLLVVVSGSGRPKKHDERITWGLRVEPGAADAGSAGAGVSVGKVSLVFNEPADYDRVAKPEAEAVARFLKDVPANRWVRMPAPPRNGNPRGWGTIPYDTVRHQWLSFGGGHGPKHYTDVTHYSMRTATWSSGYADEYPFANSPFSAMFRETFWNHPTIGHVWDGADFDPVSGKVVYCRGGVNRLYDPAKREWDYPPAPLAMKGQGELNSALTSTPHGVVCWFNNGLFLFDAKKGAWSQLPVQGGKVGGANGDSGGICHDSKRDCLWFSFGGDPLLRYDMKTGALTTLQVRKPAGVFMRETVYVPEIDMLLNMGRVKGAGGEDGNLAFDIEGGKWVGIQIPPCSDGKTRLPEEQFWLFDKALAYDPELNLVTMHYAVQDILVVRLSREGLKTFEPTIQEPKKK